ncbi:transglutaminase family protein [Spongiibacter sp. KMU-158]|uniref:Transglutaminase family protein n=1 Tax=Spongiibacter pelagi TaxID=2760804 RepID=A0A927C3M0_9GAMM|nr:transglutaminase family protein [Spongiibacter pelagi]MBD2859553.1 transglutaminase family protein [Spongiibacter pelagi]
MKYHVRHTTRYDYSDQVSQGYSVAYLLPRDCRGQRVLRSNITISPSAASRSQREDYFGNVVVYFNVEKPHNSLEVTVDSEIEIAPTEKPLLASGITCGEVRQALQLCTTAEEVRAVEFLYDSPMIKSAKELREFGHDLFADDRPFMEAVHELNSRIFSEFKYDPTFSSVATPLSEVLEKKRGVCQDFAQLAIGVLRSQGLAARYVSGYLETLPPPGQEKLQGADASHAWFSVYVPGDGWNDFDPTNDMVPADQHITTAWGRDYSDVTPLKGVVFGGGSDQVLSVAVDVERNP